MPDVSPYFVVQYYRIDDATGPQDALDKFLSARPGTYGPEHREVENWDTGETWDTSGGHPDDEYVIARHADPR